jgi:hypothetical protein
MTSEKGVITTPLRALIAMAVTGRMAAHNLYSAMAPKPLLAEAIHQEVPPLGLFVAARLASEVLVLWCFIVLVFSRSVKKEEKVIWLALGAVQFPITAHVLFPRITGLWAPALIGIELIAFLAAVALFKLLCEGQEGKKPL